MINAGKRCRPGPRHRARKGAFPGLAPTRTSTPAAARTARAPEPWLRNTALRSCDRASCTKGSTTSVRRVRQSGEQDADLTCALATGIS